MRHGVKKIKFRSGRDANRMLFRKMATSLLMNGKIVTTEAKAKALKPIVEKLVTKIKKSNQSDHNIVLKKTLNFPEMEKAFPAIKSAFTNVNSGFLRIIKLKNRENDGTLMVRLEWAHQVVYETAKIDKNKSVDNKAKSKKI